MSLQFHQRSKLVTVLGLCFLLIALSPIETTSSSGFEANDWVIECVDCPRYFDNLTNRSAVLDVNDLPHVAYGGDHLYYEYLDGDGEWQSEVVDESPRVGFSAAMVLDSNGHPYILYYDSANSALKYASYDGVDWQIEPFPFGSLIEPQLSLAVDSSDQLHVSFYNDVAGDLIYGVQRGSGWYFEVVDSNDDVGKFSSIAVDGNDLPHISYHDVTNTQLKYASFDGVDWTVQTFPEENQAGYDTDITLDQDGYVHIVYRGRGTTSYPALMYRFQDAGGWHLEIVDESEMTGGNPIGVGYFNSIEIDNNGDPHVSYSAKGLHWYFAYHIYELRYAHRTNGSWNVELINDPFANNSTVLLHNSGDPSIIYKNDNELQYASKTDLEWGEITLELSEFVGQSSSVDMVFLDQPHVSYHEREGYSIKYAERNSGGWSALRIARAGWGASTLTRLSLSPTGNPHILYARFERYGGGLRHAYTGGEIWFHESPWEDILSYRHPSKAFDLVVDIQGQVHAVHGIVQGGAFYYLYKEDSWRDPEFIYNVGSETSTPASITIASSGQIHIAFTGDSLGYSVQEAGGWSVETVDRGDISYPSIDLDSNGFPHISYYDETNGDLKYAKYNGTTWTIEIVDEVGDVGAYSSLGIDLQDFTHISYYDATNGDLKYAYFNGSEWEINTLVSEGDVGSHCSLTLDPFGNPYITFHDAGLGDLKIIYLPHGTVYQQIFPYVSR